MAKAEIFNKVRKLRFEHNEMTQQELADLEQERASGLVPPLLRIGVRQDQDRLSYNFV